MFILDSQESSIISFEFVVVVGDNLVPSSCEAFTYSFSDDAVLSNYLAVNDNTISAEGVPENFAEGSYETTMTASLIDFSSVDP